jgi:hypothetical protein
MYAGTSLALWHNYISMSETAAQDVAVAGPRSGSRVNVGTACAQPTKLMLTCTLNTLCSGSLCLPFNCWWS